MLRITNTLGLLLDLLLGLPPAFPSRYESAAALVQDDDCPRGAAEPVVQKKVFPKTSFRRLSDHHSGLETVTLPSGDRLAIRHEGCEYYVLRFRFETTRFQQSPKALESWFRNTAQLLTETLPGLKVPVNLEAGIKALRAYTSRHARSSAEPLTLDAEIEFGNENMRSFLTVDHVQKLTANKVAVEVTLAIGPL